MRRNLPNTLNALAETFEDAGVDGWALFGAHAANMHRREPRSTLDVDVLVSLSEGTLAELRPRLVNAGWSISSSAENWLLRLKHDDHLPVDVILVEHDYHRTCLERATATPFGDGIRALSIEDILILKLLANRIQDDADVVSILHADKPLDAGHMEKWLGEFELHGKMRDMRVQAAKELESTAPPALGHSR